MTLVLTYLMTFQNSEGSLLETEVDVDYQLKKNDFEIGELDETARRYLIARMMKDGGRVIRLERINVETS